MTTVDGVQDAAASTLELAGWPVLVAALLAVVWALTAKARFGKFHDDKVIATRRRVVSGMARPVLANLVRIAHDTLDWPEKKTFSKFRVDEQVTTERITAALGTQPILFQTHVDDLERQFGKLRDLEIFRSAWLRHSRRQGFAMTAFAACWVYGLAWQREFSDDLPNGLSIAFLMVGSFVLGWFVAEKLGQWAITNNFEDIKRAADKVSIGENE